MNQIAKKLITHHKKILFIIFSITCYLFYYAFFSDNHLKIDFSLEQMFPEKDPEKELYDKFRSKFSREDNSALMIYVPPTHPLNMENLLIVNGVVRDLRQITSESNCIDLRTFPCNDSGEIDYEDLYSNNIEKIAYFYDYDITSDSSSVAYIRVFHFSDSEVVHNFTLSNLKSEYILTNSDFVFEKIKSNSRYSDYAISLDEYQDDFLCFDEVSELSNGIESSISFAHTPFYMIDGCGGEYSEQNIYSLSNVRHNNELLFDLDPLLISNEKIYFNDCGYDGLCPEDVEFYTEKDPGERNNMFDCEPFDCGLDGVCSPNFYLKHGIKLPLEYQYNGSDYGEGDFGYHDWDTIDEAIYNDELEFLDLNFNGEFDCEYYDYSKYDIEAFIKDHPLYNNLILSKNSQVGGIYFTLDSRVKGQELRSLFFNQLDDIISKNKNNYNWEWHDGGIPVLRTRYVELVHKERNTFIPLAFLVVIVILFFVFRNIKSIVLPILSMSITLVWVSALMAFLGISINVVSYLTYNLLLIIGCSNAIHIQMKYHEGLYKKESKINALRNVINKMGGAIFLTSFTTSIGFFSLCMTNIKLTKDFGMILGVGVFIMFLMMIIVLPLLLLITKTPNKEMSSRLMRGGSYRIITWINKVVVDKSKVIVFSSCILFVIVAIGLFKIDYNVSILDDLRPRNQLYKDIKAVEGNMGGVFPVEIILEYEEPIISNQDIRQSKLNLKNLNDFKKNIAEIEQISNLITFTDLLSIYINGAYKELLNEEFLGSQSLQFDYRNLPSDDAEFIKIFNKNSEFIQRSVSTITSDLKTVRISGRMFNIKASEAADIKIKVADLANSIFENNVKVYTTGSTFLALKTADHLVYNLTNSFALAFVIIFISMVFLFKSFKLSLISILPNIIPLMLAAAVMGYQDIKLRPTTAMTFAIALGIAVDDTIHFLARFRQEIYLNNNIKKAIKNTLLTTGKAIISTTMVLCLGFAVLYFSELMPNHEFGILATIILIVALLGSIFLLPALLIIFKPKIILEKANEPKK